MSFPETDLALLPALQGQPIERVLRDGFEYVVLGTAHVSLSSVEAVDALLAHEHFDAVAVELCDSRAQSMRDPEAFKQMDLFKVIRQGKAGMVAASLVLSTFQKRLADQSGIQPGAEMKAAMDARSRVHTERRQALLIIEAMKMEVVVLSPVAGVIKSTRCSPGQAVSAGDILAVIG